MRLRHLMIGVGILVALIAIAAAVFVVTFDANRYKATIVDFVEQRTQRKLAIEGDLSLRVLPRIALSVGRAQLSGPAGRGEFAQIESARIGVALRPLLSREVRVERIALDGLKLEAVRRRDGSTNFDDLLALGDSSNAPAQRDAPQPSKNAGDAATAAATAVSIAQLQLRNSSVGWTDEANGSEWRLQALDLDADRIASGEPGRLRLTGRLLGKQPQIDAQLELEGGYRAEFDTGRVELNDVRFAARTDDGIAASVDAPALAIAGSTVEGKPIRAQLRLHREESKVDATLSFAAPSSSDGRIEVREIHADVTASGSGLPADGVKLALVGNGSVDTTRESGSIALRGTIDGSPVRARLDAAKFSPLVLRYELQADRVDVDRYAGTGGKTASGPAGPAPAPAPTPSPAPAGGGSKSGAPGAGDAPIPVPPIADVDTQGTVRIGQLRARGIDAREVAATIRSGGGRIEVTRISAGVFGGSLAGSASLGANGRHALKMQLEAIDISTALRQLADRELLDGRGNFAVDVTGAGNTVQALERSLAGSARLALRDGAIVGIDLNKAIERVQTALAAVRGGGSAIEQQAGGGERTAFTSLQASFAIRDGVARSDDLDMRSPLLRVGGSGQVNLPASTVDYLLRVSIVGSLAGQGGAARSELRGLTIPVRVSGPFASLGYRIDTASLARDAIEKGVTRQLEERLLGKPKAGSADGTEPNKRPDPREMLRGLIGR